MTQQSSASPQAMGVIQRLADSGITFNASHDGPAGKITVTLTPSQLEMFLCDPAAAFASVYGVTRGDYLSWQAAGYMAQCAELTTKGRQCRNPVHGGHLVETPDRWVALRGDYCLIHQEGSSND